MEETNLKAARLLKRALALVEPGACVVCAVGSAARKETPPHWPAPAELEPRQVLETAIERLEGT